MPAPCRPRRIAPFNPVFAPIPKTSHGTIKRRCRWQRQRSSRPTLQNACSPPRQKTPYSLLWLAAIQIVERMKNLPGLAPKDSFIATEAVERIVGQIGEPQETTCELNIRSNLALGQSQSCSWARLDCIRDTVRRDLPIRGCIEKRINDLTRDREDLVRLLKLLIKQP